MLGRLPEAGTDLAKALRIEPRLPQAWSNRGKLFLKLQQPEAALAAFEKAMALRPGYVEALTGRAVALKYLGRFETALEGFDAALACDPASAHANNNKAALLLLRGDFERGLELYEYRWILSGMPKYALNHPVPEWQGDDPDGCSIAVFDEQGHGDAIQFARYLLILAGQGANVTFFCRKSLRRLFKGLDGQIKIANDADANERFDYQTALSSLPRAFKTRLAPLPATLSYLSAEALLVQKWAAPIGSHGFTIGICWRGNPNIKADPARSIPLACFTKLTQNRWCASHQHPENRGLRGWGDLARIDPAWRGFRCRHRCFHRYRGGHAKFGFDYHLRYVDRATRGRARPACFCPPKTSTGLALASRPRG